MLSKRNQWYKLFGFDNNYEIDKNQLKTNYYKLTKSAHPDMGTNIKSDDILEINKAYNVFMNDFLRAKLFTIPSKTVDSDFLKNCLELEDKIQSGEDLKNVINSKIKECRKNYDKPEWLAKWAYYERLNQMANEII